jgi:uncharacterized membrane protein
MRIPAWRLALTGSALALLAIAGIGVTFASAPPDGGPVVAAVAGSDALALDRPLLRYGRHVVHGTVTVEDVDQGLITFQLDGGTISSVDADSVTVSEAGGASVTVAIDERNWVRIDRHGAQVKDLATGQKVVIVSRVGDGGATARLIVVPPAEAD